MAAFSATTVSVVMRQTLCFSACGLLSCHNPNENKELSISRGVSSQVSCNRGHFLLDSSDALTRSRGSDFLRCYLKDGIFDGAETGNT